MLQDTQHNIAYILLYVNHPFSVDCSFHSNTKFPLVVLVQTPQQTPRSVHKGSTDGAIHQRIPISAALIQPNTQCTD